MCHSLLKRIKTLRILKLPINYIKIKIYGNCYSSKQYPILEVNKHLCSIIYLIS